MYKESKKCFEFNGSVIRNGVVINGIPTADELTALFDDAETYNQLDVTEFITIPDVKPDVEQVNEATLKVCLEDAWLNPAETKILIKGFIWQKIQYTACRSDQPMHTVEKKFPFSHFINLEEEGIELDPIVIRNLEDYIVLAPEDAFIQLENGRKLFKNVIVTAFLFLP